MLVRHHGASSSLGEFIPRSLIIIALSSSGPCSLDTVRPITAFQAMTTSAMARTYHQARSRTWQPAHGIIFGNVIPPSEPSPVRALGTFDVSNSEHNLALRHNTPESGFFTSSLNLALSSSKDSWSASQRSSDGDESSWVPFNVSQDSGADERTTDDKNSCEVDQVIQQGANGKLHTPLTFQIPNNVLQKAKEAAPGTKESFWSYKMYLGPDKQEVKVHYCKNKNTTERVAQYFLQETILGFDIEWQTDATRNSGIKNNVSLIQLASETRIALFHIAAFPKDRVPDLVAPSLKEIMEDANITKVGVAIKGDCTRLRNFLGIDTKGMFELSHLYKLIKYSSSGEFGQINKKLVSLSTQAEEHLELPVFKGEVRRSDWSQPLSLEQIKYAASDAYANFRLYDTLESKRKKLHPVPPLPYHAELNLPIRLASGAVITATDDTVEDLEPDRKPKTASPVGPASVLEAAAENIQIEDEAEQTSNNPRLKSESGMRVTLSTIPATSLPGPQILADAESWASYYRTSKSPSTPSANSSPTASFPALRVYALWYHNPSLSIAQIALMLRDPPLRNSTVASYILDVIRLEKLPFEKGRLKSVLQIIPDSKGLRRYRALWNMTD